MKITTTLTPRNTSTLPPAVALQLATLLSQPGAPGIKGSVWYPGTGAPSEEVGLAGDYYIDIVSLCLYGPKTTVWGDDFACIAGTVLSADIQAALEGASTPSAENPFATVDDLPTDFDDHTNRAALDAVEGVNTGDQDLTPLVPKQSGVILGQRDTMTSYTLAAQNETVDLTYTNGNAYYIDATLMTAAHILTLTATGWPGAGQYGAMTVMILTGAAVPSVAVPSGWTAITLTASKTNRIIFEKVGAANGRHDGVVSY